MSAKKAAFDISSMLNKQSLEQANQREKRISYELLIPNEKNHYSMDGIEDLADTIEDHGLLQPLIVKQLKDGKYKIVAGHRRYEAIRLLVEQRGLDKFADVLCILNNPDEDETLTELKLHITNTTVRELKDYDKMVAISEMKRLIRDAKGKGFSLKGKVRDIIADQLSMGATQVQKYISIEEKAPSSVKQALKDGEITVEDAYAETKRKPDKPSVDTAPEQETKAEFIDPKLVNSAIMKLQELKRATDELDNKSINILVGKMQKQLDKIHRLLPSVQEGKK